jgi:hypothetical protein
MANGISDFEADLLVTEALNELGMPQDTDEYEELIDYAGCYPWLQEIVNPHPHDYVILASIRGDVAEPDSVT